MFSMAMGDPEARRLARQLDVIAGNGSIKTLAEQSGKSKKKARTEKNNKFLSSTLDQLISVPQLNRIDAYVGSKDTPTYQPGDVYITETNPLREAYQLEPALIVKTLDQEIKKAFALDDLLNQINIRGGNSSNLDRLLNPKFFPYDPKIDWDKFINFR
jgi:hypothetical protein